MENIVQYNLDKIKTENMKLTINYHTCIKFSCKSNLKLYYTEYNTLVNNQNSLINQYYEKYQKSRENHREFYRLVDSNDQL